VTAAPQVISLVSEDLDEDVLTASMKVRARALLCTFLIFLNFPLLFLLALWVLLGARMKSNFRTGCLNFETGIEQVWR
jgi:hypothetical protein